MTSHRVAAITAFASKLATESAEMLPNGELWAPLAILDDDFDALVEVFGEMVDEEVRHAWMAYRLRNGHNSRWI